MIGQDPYAYGEAHGLAFSTLDQNTPYSLRMILRELDRDVIQTSNLQEFKEAFPSNNLSKWGEKGILLLNRVLTVRAGLSNSHKTLGWQEFTDAVLEKLWNSENPIVFMAWGTEAQAAMKQLEMKEPVGPKLVLTAGHPASGSHGKDKFSGNSHFSKANQWLANHGVAPIDWKL